LGFLNEEGTFLRLKKMKHLLHALLRWREQRQAWQRDNMLRFSAIDEALMPTLQVAPSSKHNDLVLRCSACPEVLQQPSALLSSTPSDESLSAESSCSGAAVRHDVGDLHRELELLRGENNNLRMRNSLLELGSAPVCNSMGMMTAPPSGMHVCATLASQLPADVLDDPFEPPPQVQSWAWQEPLGMSRKLSLDFSSTDAGSESSFDTSSVNSRMSGHVSEATSGAMTPVHVAPLVHQGCTLVPMWFPLMPSATNFFDASVIPRGIVQSAREQFERLAGQ